MYAVIKTGGKQYRVSKDQYLKVEKLNSEVGDTVNFEDVLMIADGDKVNFGTPNIDGGNVTAEILSHGKAKKVNIIKFRRRKHHRKQMGHRQSYTEIKITDIKG